MIDAVMPLVAKDIERFGNLRSTLDKFHSPIRKILVVTPRHDDFVIRGTIGSDKRFEVIAEEELVPALGKTQYAGVTGWWRQQLIKLAISVRIETEFYLTLDADCLIVRDLDMPDFVKDGKGIVEMIGPEYHDEWYKKSGEVLEVTGRPPQTIMVTPFLFSKKLMSLLQERLFSLMRKNDASRVTWQEYLLSRFGWTEYSLYHLFGHSIGKFDEFHYVSDHSLFGNCVWSLADIATWDVSKCFVEGRTFMFTVVQSNTGLSASWVKDKIAPYVR